MLKSHYYLVKVFWLVLLFAVPLPFIISTAVGLPSIYSEDLLGINLGTFAYVWMLSLIYLGTKPKWLDRLIGLPDIYLIHGVTAIFILIFSVLHNEMVSGHGLVETTGEMALALYIGITIFALVFMAGWLTNRKKFFRHIKYHLEKIFKHELSMWLHRLNLVVVILVYIHVLLIDYIMAIPGYAFFLHVYTILTFASYMRYEIAEKFYKKDGTLTKLVPLDQNVYELTIELKAQGKHPYLPGDFVYVHFPTIKGLKEPHPFSLVNAPKPGEPLILAIRGDGDFTIGLQKLKVPVPVKVSGGYGRLQKAITDNPPSRPIVLIGGGIGIVPLLSLVEGNSDRPITLLYSVNKDSALLYQEKLAEWRENKHFHYVAQKGRFTPEALEEHFPDDWKEAFYIVAGPMDMNLAYKKILRKEGVPRHQIYYESFNW